VPICMHSLGELPVEQRSIVRMEMVIVHAGDSSTASRLHFVQCTCSGQLGGFATAFQVEHKLGES
jgi:hypothetical protein